MGRKETKIKYATENHELIEEMIRTFTLTLDDFRIVLVAEGIPPRIGIGVSGDEDEYLESCVSNKIVPFS